MKNILVITAAMVLTTSAAEISTSAGDATAAFARLRNLAGQWESQGKGPHARITYEVVSGGNAVLERESNAGMPDMITVYYVDGARLLLTHYCMVGNEPRMQARSYNPQTGELQFEFLDITNLASPAGGHMHDARLRLIDNDHIASTWEFYENGKPKFTETAAYTRVH